MVKKFCISSLAKDYSLNRFNDKLRNDIWNMVFNLYQLGYLSDYDWREFVTDTHFYMLNTED